MSLSDRRRHPRFPFHSRAQLQVGDTELNGTLMDISLAGALFATDRHLDFPAGTKCRLTIYRHRRSSLSALGGEIVYCANHLFGLQFLEVSGEAENELRQLIDMNLAPPRLLERDLAALLR